MLKVLLLLISFFVSNAIAAVPIVADSYVCPKTSKKAEPQKPIFFHAIDNGLILGLCGTKEIENGNYSNFDVYSFPHAEKVVFSNHTKDRKTLVIEKKNGLLFIEKVKIGKSYFEVFKNELNCKEGVCKLEKEACALINKERLDHLYKNVKDKKVKSKMKKLGCI